MIRYLRYSEIDKTKWDKTIASACNGNVYAWSWYLDIAHPKWEALVDDDYEYVMPLTGRRKFFISYLFQPFFVQQLGVFSSHDITADKLDEFLVAVPKKFRLAEIRLNEACPFDRTDTRFVAHRNIKLDLAEGVDKIRSNYGTNTKKNLAKALKNNLSVTDNFDLEDVVDLFRKNRGAEVAHWGDAEYAVLLRLCRVAEQKGFLVQRGVREEGSSRVIAGAFFMKSHGRLVFLFSGRDNSKQNLHAMTFLLDSVFNEFGGQPLVFDFEGSDDDNLARFELGFGACEVFYPEYRMNRLSGIENRIKLYLQNKK